MSEAYLPDWISVPGETIQDLIQERGLGLSDLASRMDLTLDRVKALMSGNTQITNNLAQQLASTLGATKDFWLQRERKYREALAYHELISGEPYLEWLKSLPVKDMVNLGWLERPSTSERETVLACLRFFRVPNLETWTQRYQTGALAAFRTSESLASKLGSVATWLRQGEIESEALDCGPWKKEDFVAALPEIRKLTRCHQPQDFISKLRSICAACGVAVVVLRTPKGCPASGATRFISSDRALLMLSFRFLSDDQFWFTFFHEAGHLILHGQERMFIECGELKSHIESEANKFAQEVLVPEKFRPAMLTLPYDSKEIIRFARSIGVSPGIVVGQLQHSGKFSFHQLNRLKRRYRWVQ